MEHRDQISAIVSEAVAKCSGEYDSLASTWAEVRRRLRGLRDTTTTLREDERIALQLLSGR